MAQAFVQRRASLTQEQWETFLHVKVWQIIFKTPLRWPARCLIWQACLYPFDCWPDCLIWVASVHLCAGWPSA